jgi:hypothetical protein
VHRDVIEIDEKTWAIHGLIAYDGEVIAATFASENDAWAGLSRLDEIERDPCMRQRVTWQMFGARYSNESRLASGSGDSTGTQHPGEGIRA